MKSIFSSKLVYSILFCFSIFSININAQVGINTTSPGDGSILDVESTNKGLLIPRVNIADLSTIAPISVAVDGAESLLVYNTNTTTGKGFYYWDGSDWISLFYKDGDFHEVGTSTPPGAITDDVFRTGKIAVGKTTASYPLDIETTTDTRALNVDLSGSTDASTYSFYATNENTSDNVHYGIYSLLRNNTGTGNRYGMYTNVQIPGSQTNQAFGLYNNLTAGTGGNGSQTGTFNRLGGNVFRAKTGVTNYITGTDNAQHIGVSTNLSGTGTGNHTGVQNIVRGNGNLKGVYNTFNNSSGDDANTGMETQNTNDGDGVHKGVHTRLDGDGTGEKIGNTNYITSQNGNHTGTNNVLKRDGTQTGTTGTGDKIGVYNNITDSEGDNYGVYNYLTQTVSGKSSYGTFNDVESNNGTNYAGWFDAHGTGATYYAAVFNRGDVVANESGGNYDFRIEGQSNNNMFFVDASANRIGVGNNSPNYTLDVTGDIHFSNRIYNTGSLQHSDHVFEVYFDGFSKFNDTYEFMSLEEVEVFLKENKHLPNIQSRADVMENGWDITDGIRDNLEKVEELFLHSIEASKKIKQLKNENIELSEKLDDALNEINKLSERLDALEKKS